MLIAAAVLVGLAPPAQATVTFSAIDVDTSSGTWAVQDAARSDTTIAVAYYNSATKVLKFAIKDPASNAFTTSTIHTGGAEASDGADARIAWVTGTTWIVHYCNGVTTNSDIFRISTDNGATWSAPTTMAAVSRCFDTDWRTHWQVVNPTTYAYLRLAATTGTAYMITTNSGAAWTLADRSSTNGYAAGGSGYYVTGSTWRVAGRASSPANFAGYSETPDNGATWTSIETPTDGTPTVQEMETAATTGSEFFNLQGSAWFWRQTSSSTMYCNAGSNGGEANRQTVFTGATGTPQSITRVGSTIYMVTQVSSVTNVVPVAAGCAASPIQYSLAAFTLTEPAITVNPVDNKIWIFDQRTSAGIDAAVSTAVSTLTPLAPAGLRAEVTTAGTSGVSSTSQIELTWPLSTNDPSQTTGSFSYRLYLDGVMVGTDTVTSLDGEGVRFSIVSPAGTSHGTKNLFVDALDTDTNAASIASCAVTVDDTDVGAVDTCGDTSAVGGPGGGLVYTTPTDTAAGLRGWCADLMGDSGGSLFLCGLMLVAGAYIAMAAAFGALGGKGMPALVAGSVGGLGVAIFNIIAEVWGLVFGIVLIIISAAIVIWLARKLTGLQAGASTG